MVRASGRLYRARRRRMRASPPAVQQMVGAQGGTVTASDGSGAALPAGALASNVTISVTPTQSAPPPPAATVVGTAVTFGPEGQQFAQPVTVTLSFDASSLPAGRTSASIVVFTAPAGSSDYTALQTHRSWTRRTSRRRPRTSRRSWPRWPAAPPTAAAEGPAGAATAERRRRSRRWAGFGRW